MEKNNAIFIVGPSGSGKTTITRSYGPTSHEADKYPGLYTNGNINSSLLKKAHHWCFNEFTNDMKKGITPVIQSNTNLNPDHLTEYIKVCIKYDYQVVIVLPEFNLLHFEHSSMEDEEQIQHMIQARSEGDKIIPESAIRRMATQFKQIRAFYRQMENIHDPKEWLERLSASTRMVHKSPLEIHDISNENVNALTTCEALHKFCMVSDDLKIVPESPELTFNSTHIIQSDDCLLTVLLLKGNMMTEEESPEAYIVLCNLERPQGGIRKEGDIKYFIELGLKY